LHVLTCFRPEDLDPERLGHGALDFYELLRQELSEDTGPAAGAQAGSANEDPLVADLVDRLRHRGAAVRSNYDGVLDIVAGSGTGMVSGEDAGAAFVPPVAIESDGSDRYRGMTVRERSRLRPQLLERMGWRYMPLWTIEVFTDPEGCAERISGYLGLEQADRQSPRRAAQEPPAGNGETMGTGAENSPPNEENPTDKANADQAADGASGEAAENAQAATPVAQPSSEATTSTAPHGDVIPQRAAEDDPRSWNDEDGSPDEWLKEQKPPHWG
jgi:hypothetical protein